VNLKNLKVPVTVALAAVSMAVGAGGTVAVAGAKQVAVAATVERHGEEIDALKAGQADARERLIRMETILEYLKRRADRR
jgi:hypothetical protein